MTEANIKFDSNKFILKVMILVEFGFFFFLPPCLFQPTLTKDILRERTDTVQGSWYYILIKSIGVVRDSNQCSSNQPRSLFIDDLSWFYWDKTDDLDTKFDPIFTHRLKIHYPVL